MEDREYINGLEAGITLVKAIFALLHTKEKQYSAQLMLPLSLTASILQNCTKECHR